MYIYLKTTIDNKAFLLYKDDSKDYLETLFNFLTKKLNLKPKQINSQNIIDEDKYDILNVMEVALNITVMDSEVKNTVDITKIFDTGKIQYVENNNLITLVHNTQNNKLFYEILSEVIKNVIVENINDYLLSLIGIIDNLAFPIVKNDEYSSKFIAIPFQLDNIILANMPTDDAAKKLSKVMYEKGINSFISFLPDSIVALYIKLPNNDFGKKLTEKIIKVYSEPVENIADVLAG